MREEERRRGRYYITRYFTSDDGAVSEEKMELGAGHTGRNRRKEKKQACTDGKSEDRIMVRLVREEISYMADFEVNSRQEIESVRFDPVPVAEEEEIWILNRKDIFPDTDKDSLS